MSDDIKQQKETLLRQLLRDKPDIGMKEANSVIRDQFDTGVSPPVFSKVRRAMLEESAQQLKTATKPEQEPKSIRDSGTPSKQEKSLNQPAEVEAATHNEAVEVTEEETNAADGKDVSTKPNQPHRTKVKLSKKKPKQEDQLAAETAGKDDKKLNQADSKQPEALPKDKEPEPEIDPNLPRFTVKIEVDVDLPQPFSEVHLCGGFNLWKVDELAMVKNENNHWVFEGELPQGEYTYKFVVDRKLWYLDFSRKRVTDKTGVSHSIIIGEENLNAD